MASKQNRKSQKMSRTQIEKRQAKELADQEAKQRKKDRQQLMYKIAAVVFAVLMALGIALPSLSSIVGRDGGQASISSMEDVDNTYSSIAKQYEDILATTPDDPDALMNLGSVYSSWAQMASFFASTSDTGADHVNELYAKAISAYDTYLESNESADAVIARAQVRALSGDTDTATSEMEELTKTTTDNASAWLLLGSLYQTAERTDEARAAYEKAVAADPDDAAGVKTSAQERIDAIDNPDAGTTAASGETGAGALSDALTEASGTGVD